MEVEEVRQDEILDMDATTLAEKIKHKQISSQLAIRTYISRLKAIQPSLNCLTEERFDRALQEAKQVDEQIQKGIFEGKLFGVPISIKESFDVKGMKTTGGLVSRKNEIAKEDAEVVKRLKKEGAIILGKTNTPALCFCQETDNKLYGRTNNPWSLDRTAGGSSGGEGALIAAGGAAVGIGSDIGGSIRFPSHFNGTVGFKSGNRQVSQIGSFPYISIPQQERMLGIGAIAKSVRDAELIHSIIRDNPSPAKELSSFSAVIPINHLVYPVDEMTKAALEQVKKILSDDLVILDEEPPFFRESARLWQLIMSIDGGENNKEIAFEGKRKSPLLEFLKEQLFKSSEFHPYLSWALFGANFYRPNKREIEEINEKIDRGEKVVDSYLENRILILPVYHTTALPHGKLYWELFSIFKKFLTYIPFVAYANTWGLPSLTIPVSEDDSGLPIGIQIISAVGNEDAIFQLGKWVEANTRGYKRALK
ncbi:amidase [Fervidibacillus halotolerans]|uniref:Amidase n=1 Tax=Fervidibacillus halotolerans TaxID=2980027 RepID=A0A9E8M0I2_9BACI|nr:amidase [Fervidibacillus halotolerans]WAA12757.1 amidase [Fervidibacillus halotolerans]